MLYPIKHGRTTKQFSKNRNSFGIGFGFSFNPDFDGNALAWYDGNLELTTAQWNDQGAGGHDIIFTNSPSIIVNATPLRDAVRFNGTDENGVVTTPATNQPYSMYFVLNSIAWTDGDRIFDDGLVGSRKRLVQEGGGGSPNLQLSFGQVLNSDPDLANGTWGVMTFIANGLTGQIRTNLNVAVTGNVGVNNGNGIKLASTIGNTLYWNGEMGYLIIRTGLDSLAVQDYIIKSLRTICGLTF